VSPATPRFPFVTLDAPNAQREQLGAMMFELGASGVEVRDDATLAKGPGGGSVRLVASFDTRAAAESALAALCELAPNMTATVGEVVGDEWRDKYKEHFAPFELAAGIVVAPPWADYHAKPDEMVVLMDPGRAFGTGLHDTTRLVAEQLVQLGGELTGARVLDVGTGTGVLALVALSLGAESVVAIDTDPAAVEVARENAALNDALTQLDASTTPVERVSGAFPVVVANIQARVLIPMAPTLLERVASGGALVLSGVLAQEHDEVAAAYRELGFAPAATRATECGHERDSWIALTYRRP